MALIANLIREIPALAKYEAELSALERDCARLKTENEELKMELGHYIEQWETLDGDAVKTLQHLAQDEFESADAIARTHNMNFQITEMYLQFLVKHVYVAAPATGERPSYALTSKGRRYLFARGLL